METFRGKLIRIDHRKFISALRMMKEFKRLKIFFNENESEKCGDWINSAIYRLLWNILILIGFLLQLLNMGSSKDDFFPDFRLKSILPNPC